MFHFFLVDVNNHTSVLLVKTHALPNPLKCFYLERLKAAQQTVLKYTLLRRGGLLCSDTHYLNRVHSQPQACGWTAPTGSVVHRCLLQVSNSKLTGGNVSTDAIVFLQSSHGTTSKQSHLRSYLLSASGTLLWGAAALGFRLW